MADPESRNLPKLTSYKMIRPGEEVVKPTPKPIKIKRGEGTTAKFARPGENETSAKFARPGDKNTTGATVALPYETMAAQAQRLAREAEARAELDRKMAIRNSVINLDEHWKMRANQKRLKKIGITI